MGSLLGFRPPYFSEDGAWLPCWLQHEDNEAQPFVEGLKQGQSSSELCVEEYHNFQKHTCNVNAGQFIGGKGGYNNCYLYLSGDDSSILTVTPSLDNVAQFHLHLSLDCNSEGMESPPLDTFQAERNEIYHDLHVKQPEASGEPEVNANQLNAEHNIDVINCSLVPQCQREDNEKRSLKEFEEKSRLLEVEQMHEAVEASQLFVDHKVMNCSLASECEGTPKDNCLKGLEENTRLVEVEQIDDAVEMSITASEALVIHDVLRTVSSELPVAAVLEAALQVKQARLEVWKESHETCCNWLAEEINESDFQSDSEDINMEDAYHDVCTSTSQYYGLQGDNLSVSHVKDTIDSENCGHDRKSKPLEVQLPNTSFLPHNHDFVNHNLEDAHENDRQLKQNIVIESSDSDSQNKALKDSSMGLDSTSISRHNNPMLHLLGQTGNYNPKEDCSLQATVESPLAKRFAIDGTLLNRFQSRWFGGWTGNDTNFSIPMRQNNFNVIADHFVGETSYLSESADIAPDENSFAGPKDDEKSNFVSQSTMPSEGLYMNGNNQVLHSQDVSRSSSPSFVDPLCSVVPCSIPSQNMPCHSALCGEQVNMKKCFIPDTEHIENLQSNSNLDNKVLPEQFSISKANADRPEHSIHKKLTSMKGFSMLPSYGASMDKGSLSKTYLLEKSDTLQYLPPANMYGSTENGHEFPSGLQKEMNAQFMSKSMTKGSVQHSNRVPSEFSAEANRKQIEGSQTIAGSAPNPNLLKLQPIHENQNTPSLGTRKRVRFAEIEVKAPHREKRQKQQITSNTCHAIRPSKSLRLSSSHFEPRFQNLKGHLTNCQAKSVKKLLFQSIKFLLTGFSRQKLKRIECLIRKYGGTVLSDIPLEIQRKRSSRYRDHALPVVLCPKKLQTMKFLYGCAVGALMVKAEWLTASIAASSLLPPEQYTILQKTVGGSSQTEIPLKGSSNSIFHGVGIMLHGAKKVCTGMAKIIEHGGGRVFKTLQKLVLSLDAGKINVGFVVTEDESWASRHLKQCALEKKIPIMSIHWIVSSLHAQKLLPFFTEKKETSLPLIKLPDTCGSVGWSQEI